MCDFEVEEFWDDLLSFIETNRVIPVVGPELLTLQNGVPLYRAVSNRLLSRYGLSAEAGTDNLFDAVCAIVGRPRVRIADLYRVIHNIIRDVLAETPVDMTPLRSLAAIRHFDLFVTTTPDDLMACAIADVRELRPDEVRYAPKLSTESIRDIAETASSRYSAVFYMFGKADVQPFYAIHDEDALEFSYQLQLGQGPERMLSQMRNRSLLFIGCAFAQWLSRFFIRLSNSERLASAQRTKKEYLVGQHSVNDKDLVVFPERFSQESRLYSGQAPQFVSDLIERWRDRNPSNKERARDDQGNLGQQDSAANPDAVFISYAHDDIGAATALRDALSELGADVVWFDKNALKPGDNWEAELLRAIRRCRIFVPLLSANTESRTDGYFHREWDEAAERSRTIQGRRFIFPTVVDKEFTGNTELYRLVPERFRSFQFSHAPGGQITSDLRAALQDELRKARRGKTA